MKQWTDTDTNELNSWCYRYIAEILGPSPDAGLREELDGLRGEILMWRYFTAVSGSAGAVVLRGEVSPMSLRVVNSEPRRSETNPGLSCACGMEPLLTFSTCGLNSVRHKPVSSARLGFAPRAYGHGVRGLTISSDVSRGLLRPEAPPTGSPRLAAVPAPPSILGELRQPYRHFFRDAIDKVSQTV